MEDGRISPDLTKITEVGRIVKRREGKVSWEASIDCPRREEFSMKLMGLRIKREVDSTYEVTPLYYSKRGGTRTAPAMRKVGMLLETVVGEVLAALSLRGDR